MTDETPVGFRLPLYRSLTEEILLAGAPKGMIVLNVSLMAFFIMTMHFLWIIPLNIVVHIGAVFLTKQDDRFFDCLRIYIGQKNYYGT